MSLLVREFSQTKKLKNSTSPGRSHTTDPRQPTGHLEVLIAPGGIGKQCSVFKTAERMEGSPLPTTRLL